MGGGSVLGKVGAVLSGGVSVGTNLIAGGVGAGMKALDKANRESPRGLNPSFYKTQKAINGTEFLTEDQKAKWIEEMNKAPYTLDPWKWNDPNQYGKATTTTYRNKLADLGRDISARKVFVQEQFNALDQSVNSKLQQNRLTSFLGATQSKASI